MLTETTAPDSDDLSRVRKERDLYLKLLQLGAVESLDPFLEEALALIVDVAGARRGYIEVGRAGDHGGAPRWWIARGFSDEEIEGEVRKGLSQGVMAEAIAQGVTIVTASALGDPRFKKLGSVRRNKIEAVLCTPIGVAPPMGVIYLQDRIAPGPFTEDDQSRIEVFARHLRPFVDRLLTQAENSVAADPTKDLRAALKVARLVGRSAALARVLKDVRTVAARDLTVLLIGPTGSGKSDIAQVIHDNSARVGQELVHLNCANLSPELADSELFGHVRGAFTGADKSQPGKIAAANKGTLFLDEVGDLPPGTQAKLLKFLDSQEYYPVGSSTPSRADVRVIAATNVDLELAAKERRFRDDLYYRLRGYTIRVPALSERREDIAALVNHFGDHFGDRVGIPRLRFSPSAIRAAEAAPWPGNIRELKTTVEEAALRAHDDGVEEIDATHLFPSTAPSSDGRRWPTLQAVTRAAQAKYVSEVLEDLGWNINAAADRLDVVRSHVYNLIKAFGLKRRP